MATAAIEVTREQILALHDAAWMAIADEDAQVWRVARTLSALAEALIVASGLHPAFFGNVLFRFDLKEIEIMGDSTPACCAACGGFVGAHAVWCIHADERASEPPIATREHYFGCCPVCHGEPVHLFVGRDDWYVCEEHKLAWWVGSGLFSGWRELDDETQERNAAFIQSCERLSEPPVCTCVDSGQDDEGECDDEVECDDVAAGELLDWLDLPADFPEPPAELS